MWAWGDGNYGQLGNSTIPWRIPPVQIDTRTDWASVSCGGFHTLALTGINSVVVDAGPDQLITLGYGTQSATLTATASGGTAPYTYLWSTTETTSSITVSPTSATPYTVTVTDASNQTATDGVWVNVLDWQCGNNATKVMVCHNGHMICVAQSAVPAHLDHGDYLGACTPKASAGNFIPSEFTLHQNYPNPFAGGTGNPSTTISFGIPEEGAVRLVVYDLYGREVATLVDEIREPGTYRTHFNGTELPSGIYMYQLEWNGSVQVKTMTLLK